MSLSAPCTTRSRIAGIERTRTLPPSFGISCLRAGSGWEVCPVSSSRSCSSRASAPCASTASKVTPSTPGAPSFCLAISYAARRVSTLQTWTYRPQKRQDGMNAPMVVADGIDGRVALHQDQADARRIQKHHLPVRRGRQMLTADDVGIELRAFGDVTHGYAEVGKGSDRNHVTLPL